jgi:hypothetical protein
VFQMRKWVRRFALLWLSFGLVCPPLAQSVEDTDPTLQFRASEAREILQVLREYPLVTQERDSLREALTKANMEIGKKDAIIAKQTAVLSLDEQIIAKLQQIDEVRMKEVDIYRRIAATETERRERETARAERYETLATIGTVVGAILGMVLGVYANR